MMLRVLLSFILVGVSTGLLRSLLRPFELILVRDNSKCSVVSIRHAQLHKGLLEESGNYVIEKLRKTTPDFSEQFRIFSYDQEVLWAQARAICSNSDLKALPDTILVDLNWTSQIPPLHIEHLINSGPSNNRVDLVFFSDGYTAKEYDKFMEDATRLAKDLSGNQTFNTVKPLLNFWAAFSPSNESGIGKGGKPKDTTFGLYRDGTELRGVYCSKPEIAQAACLSMGNRCDYPILMGNDPFYGGLGGQFTITTSSLANGALVLRHELGHSIINVGEEYDGGFAYFGVNSAHNMSSLSWSHWLSHAVEDSPPRAERSVMPIQEYPWVLLNATTARSTTFNSSGAYSRHLVKFSLSGIPHATDLTVEFDGADLGWIPREDIGSDRWHYNIYGEWGLGEGVHEIKFTLNNKEAEGQAQLCSLEILEFGDQTQFNATPGYYGAFPTFSDTNETSYRPTNEDCLMRAVTKPNFCKVCLEGLWLNLLKRIDLIDDIYEECELDTMGNLEKILDLQLIPLAEFRHISVGVKESFKISWTKDGEPLDAFTNKTRIKIDGQNGVGRYVVDVKFVTDEVLVDSAGFLTAQADHTVEKTCTKM